jgi:hypothetical protein
MTPVNSSNAAAIGYDAAAKDLYVEWHSGKTSVYSSVPANVAADVQRAPSVGKAVNTILRGTYQHRYVDE